MDPNYFSTPKKPKLLSEFSTPKKPGILIKHNNDGKQNCKETPIKSVTDKSKVKFKDDIGCTPIIDLPVKIPSCGDQETNKSVQLNTCPGNDKKEQNSVPNIVKKTNDTPVEVLTNSSSSISNIETRPKRMLRLSLGKKRKRSNKEESVDIDSSKKQSTIDESSAKNGKNGKSARNLREKSVRYWLPSLQLNYHDKFLLINGNWLSDSHMRAANEIASKQFPELNGFQDTVKIGPNYNATQLYFVIFSYDIFMMSTETEMSSFWLDFHHWLHGKLSKWQHSVHPVTTISSKWQHFRLSVRPGSSMSYSVCCSCNA